MSPKYGLKPYSTFKDTLKTLELDGTITPKNVKELFKKEKDTDYMGFSDYMDRKMILKKKTFDNHTQGKYTLENENRHQIFAHVKDILSNPDEVWYNNPDKLENQFQSRYIKYYNNSVIIVDCKLDERKGLEVQTWYSAKKEDLSLRKGLLIRDKVK